MTIDNKALSSVIERYLAALRDSKRTDDGLARLTGRGNLLDAQDDFVKWAATYCRRFSISREALQEEGVNEAVLNCAFGEHTFTDDPVFNYQWCTTCRAPKPSMT